MRCFCPTYSSSSVGRSCSASGAAERRLDGAGFDRLAFSSRDDERSPAPRFLEELAPACALTRAGTGARSDASEGFGVRLNMGAMPLDDSLRTCCDDVGFVCVSVFESV